MCVYIEGRVYASKECLVEKQLDRPVSLSVFLSVSLSVLLSVCKGAFRGHGFKLPPNKCIEA